MEDKNVVKLSLKLSSCFSKTTSNYLTQAGIQAYQLSYEFLLDFGLLMTERGKDLAPNLINAYYDLRVKELADSGEIPFVFQEKENAAKNCYHGLLVGDKCKFSISHVTYPGQFPRKALFRGDYASNNIEISLFEEDEEKIDDSMAYAILTHGGISNNMHFAKIGFPLHNELKWAGHPLTIFDRRSIVEVKFDEGKSIPISKPTLKSLKERLGDVL